jgi:hypothetical protein
MVIMMVGDSNSDGKESAGDDAGICGSGGAGDGTGTGDVSEP